MFFTHSIDGLVQDCSISITNALEILQPCTKPLVYSTENNLSRTTQIYHPVIFCLEMVNPQGHNQVAYI